MHGIARSLVTVTCWLLLMALLCNTSSGAGTQPQQDTQKPKAPRVWMNEDLQNLKGGINVVGKPDKSTPSDKSNAVKPPDAESSSEVCESDGWADAVAVVVEIQGAQLDSKFWDRVNEASNSLTQHALHRFNFKRLARTFDCRSS